MKLSTRGRYGIHAMYELALNYGGAPVSIKTIAEKQDVPEAYLELSLIHISSTSVSWASTSAA